MQNEKIIIAIPKANSKCKMCQLKSEKAKNVSYATERDNYLNKTSNIKIKIKITIPNTNPKLGMLNPMHKKKSETPSSKHEIHQYKYNMMSLQL